MSCRNKRMCCSVLLITCLFQTVVTVPVRALVHHAGPDRAYQDVLQIAGLFNWIESLAPGLFPARRMTTLVGDIIYRHYPQTNVFLATFQGNLYFIDHTGFVLDLGPVAQWLPFASP